MVCLITMPKDERKVGPIYKVFSQDLYATDLHGDELGVRQAEVWRSKSRQFSRDAEIIGKISEAGRKDHKEKLPSLEKTGFIILRNSLWAEPKNHLDRRLVVKIFSDSGGWIGTLEEMVAEEYALTYSTGMPIVSFCVITKDNEYLTYVRQVYRGKFDMENFAFYILAPENRFEAFRIERKRVAAGDDYSIIRLNGGEKVADIDGKLADIGGEFIVKILDPILAQNDWFCRILQCFSIMLRFRNEIKSKLDEGVKKWIKGDYKPPLHRYEASLMGNPRKLTLNLSDLENV